MNLPRLSVTRLLSIGSIAALLYLTSVIVVMGSERVYWYGAGFTASSIFEMAAFYVVPVAAALWALALVPARRFHQVVLGGAIFAFVVEGVLTPIIYSDGPLPVLASLFVGWHGMLAFVGMWYLVRRWLLAGRTKLLVGVSTVFGSLWGVWALVAALGDSDLPDGAGVVLAPGEFALYAFGIGIVFAAAHWLIGFVWPQGWTPSPVSTWIVGIVSTAYFAIAVLPAVPWAPLKLGVLLGVTIWLMHRGSRDADPTEPTTLDRLAGRVPLTSTWPVLLAPIGAAITYAAVWLVGLPDAVLGGLYWLFVTAQVVGGVVAYLWAARRSLGSTGRDCDAEETVRHFV